mgnify:CR=1 FL=1
MDGIPIGGNASSCPAKCPTFDFGILGCPRAGRRDTEWQVRQFPVGKLAEFVYAVLARLRQACQPGNRAAQLRLGDPRDVSRAVLIRHSYIEDDNRPAARKRALSRASSDIIVTVT